MGSMTILCCIICTGLTPVVQVAAAAQLGSTTQASTSMVDSYHTWFGAFATLPTAKTWQTGAGDQPETGNVSALTGPKTEPPTTRWHTTVTPTFAYTFGGSIENDNGRLRLLRTGVNLDLAYDYDSKTQLDFNIDYNLGLYSFDNATTRLLAGTTVPFNDIHELTVRFGVNAALDDHWAWFAGVRGQAAGESDVNLADAGSIGGYGGVQYTFSSGHSVGIGVLATSQIEDNIRYLPILNVDWAINEDWRLKAQGISAEVIRKIDDKTQAALGVSWEQHRFRLSDDAPALAAVVQDTSMPVYLRLGRRLFDGISVDFFAGVALGRELKFEDRSGRNQRDFTINSAPMMGLNVKINF